MDSPQMDRPAVGVESITRIPERLSILSTISSPSFLPFENVMLATVAALVLPLLLFYATTSYRRITKKKAFRFMDLPPELRDMVYDNLIENPAYPPPPVCPKQVSKSDWVRRARWWSASTPRQPKPSNWIMLANKQIFNEYMDLLCKRATFNLTISPQTSETSSERLLQIPPSALKELRSCNLKLVTTSSMLGVPDPRRMVSADWALARQIRQELTSLTNVSNLTLDARAIGDPLWNPLWMWYHAYQSFKNMGTPDSDTALEGPKLKRITFSLDAWMGGENYLERDMKNNGQWTWYCMKGHDVALDGTDMAVREFCGKIYQDCHICRPVNEEEVAA